MVKISTSDFKRGIYIEFRGEPCQMTEVQFVSPGKGSAFVRTSLKNVKTGKVVDFTYKSGEQVVEIPVDVSEMQFLYKDQNGFAFMDPKTYEQTILLEPMIGQLKDYLKEGDIYQILLHNGEPLSIRTPAKIKLKVTEAHDAAAGNTVSGNAMKQVIVETGLQVNVPLFVKEGEIIIIRPETGEYLGRE